MTGTWTKEEIADSELDLDGNVISRKDLQQHVEETTREESTVGTCWIWF